jgi:amino acid permease
MVTFARKAIVKETNYEEHTVQTTTTSHYVDSISIILTAYGFIYNLFPIYTSIRERNNSKGYKAVEIALSFSLFIYVGFSIMAIYNYGNNLDANIFVNIQ